MKPWGASAGRYGYSSLPHSNSKEDASPCALADRAVFWGELGLVAAPQLLSRLGQVLQDASDEDPELREAMRLAAQHVASKCSVWPTGRAGFCQSETDVKPDEQLVDAGSSSQGSGSCSDDAEAPSRPRGIFRLAPEHCLVGLLPGLGGLPGKLAWTSGLVAGATVMTYRSLKAGVHWDWMTSKHLSGNVAPIAMVTYAAKLLFYIPFVFSVTGLVRSAEFDEELRAALKKASGETLRSFMRSTVCMACLVLLCLTCWELRFPAIGSTFIFLMTMLHVLLLVAIVMFLLVWKLSMLRIEGLREWVGGLPADTFGCWPEITREYQATVSLVDEMWRRSGLSFAYALIFASDMVFIILMFVVSKADIEKFVSEIWILTIKQIAVTCAGLFLWAQIHSACASGRHVQRSVLYLARRHIGSLRPQDAVDHLCFLQCVQGLHCGVEIRSVGLVSMGGVRPLLRVLSLSVPVIVGVTLRVAVNEA